MSNPADSVPQDRHAATKYLLVTTLSALFGVVIGNVLESHIGGVLAAIAAALVWGLVSNLAAQARESLSVRVAGIQPAVSAGTLHDAALGIGYIVLGASPLLATDPSPGGVDLLGAVMVPWLICTIACLVRKRSELLDLPRFKGPISFAAGWLGYLLSIPLLAIQAILLGLGACGLAAAIAVGVPYADWLGYWVAACGVMVALGVFFPGPTTTGFDEGRGMLVAMLWLGGLAGWPACLITYY